MDKQDILSIRESLRSIYSTVPQNVAWDITLIDILMILTTRSDQRESFRRTRACMQSDPDQWDLNGEENPNNDNDYATR